MEKICSQCRTSLSLSFYYKDKTQKSGLKSYCKQCDKNYKRSEEAIARGRKKQNLKRGKCETEILKKRNKWCLPKKERDAKYRKTPQGKMSAKNQKYKRRSLLKGFSIKADEWSKKLLSFDNKCAYCSSDKDITIDHFYPLSKGGLNVIENVVPCCKSCNSKKQAKDAELVFGKDKAEEVKSKMRLDTHIF